MSIPPPKSSSSAEMVREALVVGSDPKLRLQLSTFLTRRGFRVSSCQSYEQGIGAFRNQHVVVAQVPPGSNGEVGQFVSSIRGIANGSQPVILGIGNQAPEGGLSRSGLNDLIPEPVDEAQLISRVDIPETGGSGRIEDLHGEFSAAPVATAAAAAPPAGAHEPPAAPPRLTASSTRSALERILSGRRDLTRPQGDDPSRSLVRSPFIPADGPPPDADALVPANGGDRRATEAVAGPVPEPPAAGAAPIPGRAGSGVPGDSPAPSSVGETPGPSSEESADPVSPPTGDAGRVQTDPATSEARPEDHPAPPAAPGHGGSVSEATALRILLENSRTAVALFDTEMRYLAANRLWLREFHLEDVAVIGRSQYELFPDLHESWREIYRRCLDGHTERCDDDVFERPDGSRDWVRWEVRPWHDDRGRVGGLAVSCEVITHLRETRRQLAFERALAGALFSTHTAPIMVTDLDGRVVRANPAARELAPCERLVENAAPYWSQLLTGDERDAAAELHAVLREAEDPAAVLPPRTRETLHLPTGEVAITWVNIPKRAASGKVTGIVRVGTALEPVEAPADNEAPEPAPRDTAEEQPQPEPAAPTIDEETLYDQLPEPVWRCSRRGALTFVNRAWEDLRGGSREKDLGKGWLRLFHPDDRQALAEQIAEGVNTHASFTHECRIIDRNGRWHPVLMQARPAAAPEPGAFDGLVGTLTNIQAQVEMEQAVRSLSEELAAVRRSLADTDLPEAAGFDAPEPPAARDEGDAEPAGVPGDGSPSVGEDPTASAASAAHQIAAHAPFGLLLVAPSGELVFHNPQHAGILGTDAADFESLEAWLLDRCVDDQQRAEVLNQWRDRIWRKQVSRVFPLLTTEGILKDIEFRPTLLPGGNLLLVVSDVTDSHRTEEALQRSEARHRALVRDCGVAVAAVDRTGDICLTSRAFDELAGCPPFQARRLRIDDFLHPDDRTDKDLLLARLRAEGRSSAETEARLVTRENEVIPVRLRASLVEDDEGRFEVTAFSFHPLPPERAGSGSSTSTPSTDALAAGQPEEAGIAQVHGDATPASTPPPATAEQTGPAPDAGPAESPAVDEPAATGPEVASEPPADAHHHLLREVHHRVRDNLQVLSSLLNLQRERIADANARAALTKGRDRIRSLAFVHEQLSGQGHGSSIATVDFTALARSIGSHLLEAADRDDPGRGAPRIDVIMPNAPVAAEVATAVPLALILNELVGNALDHAFPEGIRGTIGVEFELRDDGSGLLAVRDDGVGLPAEFDLDDHPHGLGLRIVRDLAAQLGGRLEVCDDDETEFRVHFRHRKTGC